MIRKIKKTFMMVFMFLMVTALSFAKEAQSAKTTNSFSSVIGSSSSGSGQIQASDFSDVIEFLITFRTVIIVVISVAGTVYFLIGLFKFFANPELSQITQYVVVFVLAIIISFAVYKIVDKISGTEIPLNAVVTNEMLITESGESVVAE